MEYQCNIIYGGKPVFKDGTTASSPIKAEMNTWYKYMKRTGYPGPLPIFMNKKKEQMYSCKCIPINPPNEPKNIPPDKPKNTRYQPSLFEKQLDEVLRSKI